MVLATTRSSRFFVVLLHLVGVSRHLRPNLSTYIQWNATGIQGVHPSSIQLEISDPSLQDVDEIMQLHWLQDQQDEKCLSPMGNWAECGDSTMWRIIPSNRRHARRRQWIRWATEEEDVDTKVMDRPHAYALQLVDYTHSASLADDFQQRECLSRRRKDNKLVLVSCTEDRAWFWKVNENGILYFDKPLRGSRSDTRKNTSKKRLLNTKQTLQCLWRKDSEAMLHPCDGRSASHDSKNIQSADNAVQIEFVRLKEEPALRDVPKAEPKISVRSQTRRDDDRIRSRTAHPEKTEQTPFSSVSTLRKIPPSQADLAHVHAAAAGLDHKERRSVSRIATFLPHQSPDLVAKELPRLLGYSNPILVVSKPKHQHASTNIQEQTNSMVRDGSPTTEKKLVRKIQMNPYIASSKDERWTDPQTGLVYHTDLCGYLGHERKEAGRHTLTGVGQYTKTMLSIKVYGVGFFVSKRDVLADPVVEQYASHSSEELRKSPQFFEILRKMDGFSNGSGPAGKFDRTLFLKTNMQLATDTMRSSLDADWKMLTQEAKDLLIGSSMKARPAGPETLTIIDSSDNPNRCSCAQIAPDEYNADPSCCARGTELVFTWRKSGNLEIRLNGMFMDTFPRPDIAEGIFYEYLRTDNPMSTDFLDRVVEGFPFLLAPLSQVKGVTSPVLSHPHTPNDSQATGNPFVRTIGGFGGVISSQASTLAELLQSGAHEISANAMETAKSVGLAARNLGEELERKRELIGKHVSTFTNQALSSFYPNDQKSLSIPHQWITDKELSRISGELHKRSETSQPPPVGRFAHAMCRALGVEVCSLSASNATQKLFFGLVHLYLLLLLIASFPAQWTTRTKVVAKKASSSSSHVVSDADSSDSEESGDPSVGICDASSTCQNGIEIERRMFVL